MSRIHILILVLFVGCEQSTEPTGTVTAIMDGSQLVVANNSSAVAYHTILEGDIAARANWMAICTPENSISVSGRVQIGITESSYLPSNEAIVYWWHQGKNKIAGTDFYGPDEIRAIVVKIR